MTQLWTNDQSFCRFFASVLANVEFDAYRWETPCLTTKSLEQNFQFVVLNTRGFSARRTDPLTFQSFFKEDKNSDGIVVFENLGKDATLVVPTPQTDDSAYGHLAAFVRNAPDTQVCNLWRVVGETLNRIVDNRPKWLSTAGGGVAWLHVRIDDRPKYYGYSKYRLALS